MASVSEGFLPVCATMLFGLSLEDHDLTVSDRTTCSNRSLAIIKTSMATGLPIWPVVMDSMFDITPRFSTAPGS